MLCASALLGGCATAPTTTSSLCALVDPIYWRDAAELEATPEPIVRQVVRHNERLRAVCPAL